MGRHSDLAWIACALAVAGSASAATRTGSLAVSATVVTNCLLTSATMNFGTFTPGTGDRNANGAVEIRCTDGLSYTVGLGTGLAAGATELNRSMRSGLVLLSYQLFRNAARTLNWGETRVADRVTGVGGGLGVNRLHRIFGRIPDAGSNRLAIAGGYTDTVLVTITY